MGGGHVAWLLNDREYALFEQEATKIKCKTEVLEKNTDSELQEKLQIITRETTCKDRDLVLLLSELGERAVGEEKHEKGTTS